MPSVQRGQVFKKGNRWAARWYDETGRRRFKGGFGTKGPASDFLRDRLDEVEALRRGDVAAIRRRMDPTLRELTAEYLGQHQADPATIKKLTAQLRLAERAFGDVPIARLDPAELAAWRTRLSPGYRHDVFRALRQVLEQARRWDWIERNPAAGVSNPKPKRPEIRPFESWEEIDAVAAEIDPRFAAIPVFAAGTGLRPEEWAAVERRDLDRDSGVVTVARVYSQGVLKEHPKTSRSRRRVPLRRRVVEAIEAMPKRMDSPLLFPAPRGGHVNMSKFRAKDWKDAVRAAGIAYRPPYALRHTYATWSLRAGVSLFTLARRMGCSVAMIDETYGHLAPDAEEQERGLLDAFDEAGRKSSAATN